MEEDIGQGFERSCKPAGRIRVRYTGMMHIRYPGKIRVRYRGRIHIRYAKGRIGKWMTGDFLELTVSFFFSTCCIISGILAGAMAGLTSRL